MFEQDEIKSIEYQREGRDKIYKRFNNNMSNSIERFDKHKSFNNSIANSVVVEGFDIYSDETYTEHPIYLTQLAEEQYQERSTLQNAETHGVEDVATATYTLGTLETSSPSHVTFVMEDPVETLENSSERTAVNSIAEGFGTSHNPLDRTVADASIVEGRVNEIETYADVYDEIETRCLRYTSEVVSNDLEKNTSEVVSNDLEKDTSCYPSSDQLKNPRTRKQKKLKSDTTKKRDIKIVDNKTGNNPIVNYEQGVNKHQAMKRRLYNPDELDNKTEAVVVTTSTDTDQTIKADRQYWIEQELNRTLQRNAALEDGIDKLSNSVGAVRATSNGGQIMLDTLWTNVDSQSKDITFRTSMPSSNNLAHLQNDVNDGARGISKSPSEVPNHVKYSIIERKFKIADSDKKALEEYLAKRNEERSRAQVPRNGAKNCNMGKGKTVERSRNYENCTPNCGNSSPKTANCFEISEKCSHVSDNSFQNCKYCSEISGNGSQNPPNCSQNSGNGSRSSGNCSRATEASSENSRYHSRNSKRSRRRPRGRRRDKRRLLPAIPNCEPFASTRNQSSEHAKNIHRAENNQMAWSKQRTSSSITVSSDLGSRRFNLKSDPERNRNSKSKINYNEEFSGNKFRLDRELSKSSVEEESDRKNSSVNVNSDEETDEEETCTSYRRVEYSRDSLIITFNEKDGTLKIVPRLENGVLVTKQSQEETEDRVPSGNSEDKPNEEREPVEEEVEPSQVESFCIEFRDDVYQSDSSADYEEVEDNDETRTQL